MAANPLLKRMLDAGMQFTEMSQKQAEKLVKEFVKAGQARKKDSDEMVKQIVDRGRTLSEQIVATVQAELAKQMGKFAGRLDEVEARVEALAAKVGGAAKAATEKAAAAASSVVTPSPSSSPAAQPTEKSAPADSSTKADSQSG